MDKEANNTLFVHVCLLKDLGPSILLLVDFCSYLGSLPNRLCFLGSHHTSYPLDNVADRLYSSWDMQLLQGYPKLLGSGKQLFPAPFCGWAAGRKNCKLISIHIAVIVE